MTAIPVQCNKIARKTALEWKKQNYVVFVILKQVSSFSGHFMENTGIGSLKVATWWQFTKYVCVNTHCVHKNESEYAFACQVACTTVKVDDNTTTRGVQRTKCAPLNFLVHLAASTVYYSTCIADCTHMGVKSIPSHVHTGTKPWKSEDFPEFWKQLPSHQAHSNPYYSIIPLVHAAISLQYQWPYAQWGFTSYVQINTVCTV